MSGKYGCSTWLEFVDTVKEVVMGRVEQVSDGRQVFTAVGSESYAATQVTGSIRLVLLHTNDYSKPILMHTATRREF